MRWYLAIAGFLAASEALGWYLVPDGHMPGSEPLDTVLAVRGYVTLPVFVALIAGRAWFQSSGNRWRRLSAVAMLLAWMTLGAVIGIRVAEWFFAR